MREYSYLVCMMLTPSIGHNLSRSFSNPTYLSQHPVPLPSSPHPPPAWASLSTTCSSSGAVDSVGSWSSSLAIFGGMFTSIGSKPSSELLLLLSGSAMVAQFSVARTRTNTILVKGRPNSERRRGIPGGSPLRTWH